MLMAVMSVYCCSIAQCSSVGQCVIYTLGNLIDYRERLGLHIVLTFRVCIIQLSIEYIHVRSVSPTDLLTYINRCYIGLDIDN